jgi:tetratricopeptide (TPR) repeat protein
VVALAATGATLFHRRLLGAWHANLGALEQTRVELGAYDAEQFDRLTLDQVRQREDLGGAQRHFHQALAWDSANATARQRLAQIALSRGEYAEALAHLQVLWNSGRRDRRTRLLLGDALVAEGRVQEAATVIGGLPWAQFRLLYQVETRYRRQKEFQRAAQACETILLLDPGNRTARALLEKVRPRLASGA